MALRIDYKKRNACRICYEACPGDVIFLEGR
jgi:NAD-dependent dihydropyrimidine dehydrogenase PreA subunit